MNGRLAGSLLLFSRDYSLRLLRQPSQQQWLDDERVNNERRRAGGGRGRGASMRGRSLFEQVRSIQKPSSSQAQQRRASTSSVSQPVQPLERGVAVIPLRQHQKRLASSSGLPVSGCAGLQVAPDGPPRDEMGRCVCGCTL